MMIASWELDFTPQKLAQSEVVAFFLIPFFSGRRGPAIREGMSKAKIGLGCVTFGREIDRDDSFVLLDAAMERGISSFGFPRSFPVSERRALPGCPEPLGSTKGSTRPGLEREV